MKYKLRCIGFLLFAFSAVQGQIFSFETGNFNSDEYFIELPYININDKIIIEVELLKKKRRFLVDTGAPLAISQELFAEMKPEILSKQLIKDINQKSDSLLLVRIDSLRLKNVYVTNASALVLKSNLILDCLKLDGFLGSNLLRNSIIQFDSRNQVIRIANNHSKLNTETSSGEDMLLDQQGSPFLKFKIGKKISEFVMFDSGSDVFYSMAHEKIKKFNRSKDFTIIHKANGSNQIGLYGLSDSERTYLLRIPFARLNTAPIKNIISETSNNPNSRIGSAILHHGVLTLDYKLKKYYYKSYSASIEYPNEEFPISPTFINNKLCVGKIWVKELAQELSIGDEIISVNDFQVDKIAICDALTGVIPKSTSPMKIEVKRKENGIIKTLVIQKIK